MLHIEFFFCLPPNNCFSFYTVTTICLHKVPKSLVMGSTIFFFPLTFFIDLKLL